VVWTSQNASLQAELWSARLSSTGPWVPSLVVPTFISPASALNPKLSLDALGAARLTWTTAGTVPAALSYTERPADALAWNAPTTIASVSAVPMTDQNARGDAVAVWAEGTAYYFAVKWAGGIWSPRAPLALPTAQPLSRLSKVKMGDSGDALLQWEGYTMTCRQTRPAGCWVSGLELNIARLANAAATWQLSGPLAGPQIVGSAYTGSNTSLIMDATGRAAVIYANASGTVAMTQGGNSQSWASPKTLLPATGALAAGDRNGRVTVVFPSVGEVINGDLATGTWSAPAALVGYVVTPTPPTLAVGANGSAVLASGNYAAIRPSATAPWGAFAALNPNVLEQKVSAGAAVQNDGKAVVLLSAFDRPLNQYRLFAVTGTNTGVADPVLPAPSNVVAVGKSTTSIALTWTDNARGSPVALERCAGIGCTNFTLVTQTAATNYLDYIAGGLPNTSYTYRLRSLSTTAGTTPSVYVTLVTKTLVAPLPPTNLTAVYSQPGIATLNWTNNAIGTYAVIAAEYAFCAGAGCTSFVNMGTLGTNGNGPGLASGTPGLTYSYKVRIYTDAGLSDYSNIATVTFPATVPAPDNILASAISSVQVNINLGNSGYSMSVYGTSQVTEFERCAGVGCTNFALIGTLVNPQPYIAFQDTGRTPSTSYSYRIRVNTSLGYSLYSNVSTVVTAAGPLITAPAAPASLTAVGGRTNGVTIVTLNWADRSNNEDLFQLERCQGTGCTVFTLVQQLTTNITTATDSFLQRGTNYRYRVRATNAAGASAYSNEVAVKTP
jgi:hypothetical protein